MRRASKAFLRALHKIRAPNSFEDAARGRDPSPERVITSLDDETEADLQASLKRGRGRPLITEERPWQLAGVSRRTWYRQGGKTK